MVSERCWIKSFGGRGNARGVHLSIGNVQIDAPAPPRADTSAFLTVAVAVASRHPWTHALLGTRVAHTESCPLPASALGGPVTLAINDGAFQVDVDLGDAGSSELYCWVEVFEQRPAWGDSPDYHTTISIVFHLVEARPAADELRLDRTSVGDAWSGPCDELGFVLLDVPRVQSMLVEAGVSPPMDLIQLLGEHDVADRLVAEGALIPVWGMRPWLYRVASPGSAPSGAPLGRMAGDVKRYPFESASGALTVVPGSALRTWSEFDSSAWPVLRIPSESVVVEIKLHTLSGWEPIAPDVEAGVLPTLVVRGSNVPLGTEPSLLEGVDPFAAPNGFEMEADCVL